MPYIEVITNTKLEEESCDKLNATFGKLIEIIPGKTEKWLMIHIKDGAKLCFAGDCKAPTAIVTLKAFGHELEKEYYDNLTEAITKNCVEILGVSPERFYVEYESIRHWGWNGCNFRLKPT